MFVMTVTWKDGDPTIMKFGNIESANKWATYYISKMDDPEVHCMVSVSIIRGNHGTPLLQLASTA